MIQGYKVQVVFQLRGAYAPEKVTTSQTDAGQILFLGGYNPCVTEGHDFDQVLRFF